MNNIQDVFSDEGKEQIPEGLQELLKMVQNMFKVFDLIKIGDDIELSIIEEHFQIYKDSGIETDASTSETSGNRKVACKDLLANFEKYELNNVIEQWLIKFFSFLLVPKIVYKYPLSGIEEIKVATIRTIKHMEENDLLDGVIPKCKLFLITMWDRFDQDQDMMQLNYMLKVYQELSEFHKLFFIVIELLLKKVMGIVKKMKEKLFEYALTFTDNDHHIQSSVMLLIQILIRKKNCTTVPDQLYERLFDLLSNLEGADEFFSLNYMDYKIIMSLKHDLF